MCSGTRLSWKFSGQSGLSKVAGWWQKSSATWLVSAGYYAWHFFVDGVFKINYH